ncbi:S24 family peptidase [Flavobacterium lacus]|uniref:Peptidase S24/S26A/S26B/S26C domain-containing protein n=1 Tax=Flavobacterium lacus TaxID=1353778 RepID=A0A328WJV0_9FLAO|nr:S24 family peptidase [Flavobacterium lacus]RAR46501.1 hypothetical protein B0I10_11836 [Flavobacterium lacus]
MGNINSKIDKIAEKYFGGNNSAFAKAMGTNEANIRNYRNNTIPKLDFIIAVKEKLGISFEILLGDNETIETSQVNEPPSLLDYSKQTLIPLYDLKQAGGLKKLLSLNKKESIVLGYISLPDAPKCDGALIAFGEGMHPLIKNGDYLLYKKVETKYNQLFYGEMYLLSIDVEGEEYITFKYIQKSETNPDTIVLVSFNQNFQTKEIPFANVKALALIKATINRTGML